MAEMRFEVQARRRSLRDGVLVDEVDLDSTTDLRVARSVARAFADRGFTSWVFRVEPGPRTAPVYRMIEIVRPSGSSGAGRCT